MKTVKKLHMLDVLLWEKQNGYQNCVL